MKILIKSLSILLIILWCILLSSCIDDPVNPEGNYISGTLFSNYDTLLVYEYLNNYEISISDAPVFLIYKDANFILNSYSTPYNIVISDYYNDAILKYEGLNINNISPLYYFSFENYQSYWSFGRYHTVTFPPLQSDKIIFLKFISTSKFFQDEQVFNLTKGTFYTDFGINYNQNISEAEVIYLEAEKNRNNQYQFTNYGRKHIDNLSFTNFNNSDIAFDPPEFIVNAVNILPAGKTEGKNKVSINFPGMFSTSDLVIYDDVPSNTSVIMPELPINSCRYKYTGTYKGGFYDENIFKNIFFNPGENPTVHHPASPMLKSPEDNSVNINQNTKFEISDNSDPGVYVFYFFYLRGNYPYNILGYYSTNKIHSFSEITCRGFEYKPNSEYIWWVNKLPDFSNVDELLAEPYTQNPVYNTLEASEIRTFHTGP